MAGRKNKGTHHKVLRTEFMADVGKFMSQLGKFDSLSVVEEDGSMVFYTSGGGGFHLTEDEMRANRWKRLTVLQNDLINALVEDMECGCEYVYSREILRCRGIIERYKERHKEWLT